jgi:hypothetical protein
MLETTCSAAFVRENLQAELKRLSSRSALVTLVGLRFVLHSTRYVVLECDSDEIEPEDWIQQKYYARKSFLSSG